MAPLVLSAASVRPIFTLSYIAFKLPETSISAHSTAPQVTQFLRNSTVPAVTAEGRVLILTTPLYLVSAKLPSLKSMNTCAFADLLRRLTKPTMPNHSSINFNTFPLLVCYARRSTWEDSLHPSNLYLRFFYKDKTLSIVIFLLTASYSRMFGTKGEVRDTLSPRNSWVIHQTFELLTEPWWEILTTSKIDETTSIKEIADNVHDTLYNSPFCSSPSTTSARSMGDKKALNADDDSIPQHLRAIVFGSHKTNSRSCGHSLSLRQLVSRLHTTATTSCPVCGDHFGYVHDGVIEDEEPANYVYFKYNKVAFRLSVASAVSSTKRPSSSLWTSLFGGSIAQSRFLETTAQGRIRSTFGLTNEMKILSKGKVLYSSSSTRTNKEISRNLIDMSVTSWTNRAPPSLMVVGTPARLQMAWLQNEQLQLEKGKQPWFIRMGLFVIYTSVRTTANVLSTTLGWMRRTVFGEQRIRQD